jgi:hypothetical protein
MAIYMAATIEDGLQRNFKAGPFDTSVDAAQSGNSGYLFSVIGEETPILLPIFLKETHNFDVIHTETKFAKVDTTVGASNPLAPSSE